MKTKIENPNFTPANYRPGDIIAGVSSPNHIVMVLEDHPENSEFTGLALNDFKSSRTGAVCLYSRENWVKWHGKLTIEV